jgi:hypothetical protein
MKYDYLLDESIEIEKNGETKTRKIDQDLLDKAYNRLLSMRRRSRKDFESSDSFIIQEYVTEEEMITAIRTVSHLRSDGNSKKSEVKFDDVRNMDLSLQSLEGFKESERRIIQRRLNELSEDFNLEKSTDKFLAWRVAVCELKIMQLETLVVLNPKEAASVEANKQIDTLDKQYKVFCESLNALKRQRDNTKVKAVDNSGDILNTIKSIDEMTQEVQEEQKEIEKRMKEKIKRSK